MDLGRPLDLVFDLELVQLVFDGHHELLDELVADGSGGVNVLGDAVVDGPVCKPQVQVFELRS